MTDLTNSAIGECIWCRKVVIEPDDIGYWKNWIMACSECFKDKGAPGEYSFGVRNNRY